MIASVSLGDNLDLGVARLFKESFSGYNIGVGLNPVDLNINPSALSQAGFTFMATDPAGAVIGLITALAVGFEGQGSGVSPYPRIGQQGRKDPGRAAGSPPHLGNLRRRRRYPPAELSIQGHRHHPEGQTPDQRGRSGFARDLPGNLHLRENHPGRHRAASPQQDRSDNEPCRPGRPDDRHRRSHQGGYEQIQGGHTVPVQNTDHRLALRRFARRHETAGAHHPADTPRDQEPERCEEPVLGIHRQDVRIEPGEDKEGRAYQGKTAADAGGRQAAGAVRETSPETITEP